VASKLYPSAPALSSDRSHGKSDSGSSSFCDTEAFGTEFTAGYVSINDRRALSMAKEKTRRLPVAKLPRSMSWAIEIEVSIDQFSLIDAIELITAGYRDRDRKGHLIEIFLDQDEFCAT
jgi:hypothetical protein